MRVLRGQVEDPDADGQITERMLETVATDREPAVRIWRPGPQCSFGRRDARAAGFDLARELAAEEGFPPVERRTGGRTIAYTGTTVALAKAEPVDGIREGLADRYEAMVTSVQRALWRLDVPAQRGEPERSFCPGGPSLQSDGKLAGFAQRVQRNVALVGGIVVVDGHDEIAAVLNPVYDALDVPFAPESVGSVERAGGNADVEAIVRTLQETLVDGRDAVVERVDQEG